MPNGNSTSSDSWEYSYNRVLPEILALDERDLIPVNLEIVAATTKAIGVLPMILRYRDDLAKVGSFDIRLLDKLEDYAQAAVCAHLRHTSSQLPPDELREILERATALRENFRADVTTLMQRRLIPAEVLRDLRGSTGYKNLVADLFVLGDVLRRYWPSIEGKCPTTLAELEEASHLVAAMQKVIAHRENANLVEAETANLRIRAYSLFKGAYDEIRRAVVFIRGKRRDADKIAPSLWAGKRSGKKVVEEEGLDEEIDVTLPGLGVVIPPTPAPPTTSEKPKASDTKALVVHPDGPFVG